MWICYIHQSHLAAMYHKCELATAINHIKWQCTVSVNWLQPSITSQKIPSEQGLPLHVKTCFKFLYHPKLYGYKKPQASPILSLLNACWQTTNTTWQINHLPITNRKINKLGFKLGLYHKFLGDHIHLFLQQAIRKKVAETILSEN